MRRRIVLALTILAIAGTLVGCGRYGRPVRPAPAPDSADAAADPARHPAPNFAATTRVPLAVDVA